ncbi:MAG: ATP-binding protein [Parabacteroides merdae]|nr:ATP-binding protein [Parabacteroides merdae]
MKEIDYKKILNSIAGWIQNEPDELILESDEDLVNMATKIVMYIHPQNQNEIFLHLCALNFLNASIKTECYKNKLSYDFIKSNAAKLITITDEIKDTSISYYYNKDEYCLYIKLVTIVFSFHHVPMTSEILKASFSHPIEWPGVRLQKIAKKLFLYAVNSIEKEIDIQNIVNSNMEIDKLNTDVVNEYTKSVDIDTISSENISSIVPTAYDTKELSEESKTRLKQDIISAISNCKPNSNGWYDLVKIALKIKKNGINHSAYGFQKLSMFLEVIFGDSMQKRHEGTMVYLKFPLNNMLNNMIIADNTNHEEDFNIEMNLLSGLNIGDSVDVSTYGIVKSGKISALNQKFIQLDLDNNRYIRIRIEAISSIESIKSSVTSIKAIDLSFANGILKKILVEEGKYSSLPINTNATIMMVESRRIWFVTDDGANASCSKVSIIGINKEKLNKGQRLYVSPFKGDKAYCVFVEMTYFELFECFEKLISQKKDNTKDILHSHISSILTYIINNTSNPESQTTIKKLKRQIKNVISSTSQFFENNIDEEYSEYELPKQDSTFDDNNKEYTISDSPKNNSDIKEKIESDVTSVTQPQVDIYKPEQISLQGPKIVGKIDLSTIKDPKKKKDNTSTSKVQQEVADTSPNYIDEDLLPSMGKIIRMGAVYGWIMPNNQTDNIYFNTQELVSYTGIIDSPKVGDEVIYSMSKNTQGPIAACIHKQCTKEVVEELIDKFRFNTKTCSFLKKHLDDYENINLANTNKGNELGYYLNRVGVELYDSYSADETERLFAEKLSAEEYAKGVNLLIDEVVKSDLTKSYNLFLRSYSYTKSHKMYNESKVLVKKALRVFARHERKVKYFKGLLRNINSLSDRIEITDKLIAGILCSPEKSSLNLQPYVRNSILNHKDFNGITPDQETIRTGLYKEDYIEEVKEYIKQNKADDLSYLTLIKLQFAFHPDEYDPKEDINNFLLSRAKNLLAVGDVKLYAEVRYLLRLYYSNRNFEPSLDYTVGLYLMTLCEYSVSEIEMYVSSSVGRIGYKIDDLLKKVVRGNIDNTLEIAMISSSNSVIKQRIIKELELLDKNTESIDDFSTILNDVRNRYDIYYVDPTKNFMSFISYLQSCTLLLNNEKNIIENDFDKVVSLVTDFNTGQKYNSILNAYRNIVQKIDNIMSKLVSHPTQIGYEILLPSLNALKDNIYTKFSEIEERVNPVVVVNVLESVGMIESHSSDLKVEIRNSSNSARDIHINSLKAFGGDLIEENIINIDFRLSAGDEKIINIELNLNDDVFLAKAAEVQFTVDYDDIFIAKEKRIHKTTTENRTIRFENESFVEIENKFRHASGGEELDADSDMFYGRESIIASILEAIVANRKNQIAIYGQKRSGKSSLLNKIMGKLESDVDNSVFCGKFNLQGLSDNEPNPTMWILKEIATALTRGIRKKGIKSITQSTISNYFCKEQDPFNALRDFIEHLNNMDEIKNSHFVVFIDEFTYLYQLIKEGKLGKDFMRRWIALVETPGINFQTIVAAQDTLPHFMNESYASNYFNKFSKEPLTYLTKEESLQLIKDPIQNVIFLNHTDELIYEYTSGSAFFTQIFCTRLVDYLNLKTTHIVGKEDIENVANLLCTGTSRLEPSTFECLTKEADGSDFNEEDNIKILRCIAESTRAGGHVKINDLNIGYPRERLSDLLDNLYTRRVVSKHDDGYSINVKLFVKWILNN